MRRAAYLYALNSILINNSGATTPDVALGAYGSFIIGYSWYDPTKGTATTGTYANSPNVTSPYTAGDLGELANNGGTTPTLALSATAPAIGTGTFAYIPAYGPNQCYYQDAAGVLHLVKLMGATAAITLVESEKVTTDQRGAARSAPADMGAVTREVITSNYTITAAAGANGTIEPSGAVTVAVGADQTFTFTPDAWCCVAHVRVNGADIGAPTSYVWTNAAADGTLAVEFTEQYVTNNTPVPVLERWMARYGLTNAMPGKVAEDLDGDGMATWAEYVAGTDPTNVLSRFRVNSCARICNTNQGEQMTGFVVGWASVTGRVYSVKVCTNLAQQIWTALPDAAGLPGTSPSMAYTNPIAPAVGTNLFFKVEVDLP